MEMEEHELALFETKEAKGRWLYRLFAVSMSVGTCMIWLYRATHMPSDQTRWAWLGMFGAELWYGFYWILTQSVRWRPVFRNTFKHRLSQRYEEKLPQVDIFVCTADPKIEPPLMVINTILSVMAYDYPSEKLATYLSDDGCSDLTFYSLWEASQFAKLWVPFCKKFNLDPRSPAAYFSKTSQPHDRQFNLEWSTIKKLYQEMEGRIGNVVKLGQVPKEIKAKHKGFSEWDSVINSRNHQTILQILVDGRNDTSSHVDDQGSRLPTLVYLAREKRPQYHHNFKAGALNALIRVSSEISNGPIILTLDCDMYSNNAESVRDALCFFMDKDEGHEIGFLQYPQKFENITYNDVYANSFKIENEVDLRGLDGIGGPMYIGTGCFFRRAALCGTKYTKDYREDWMREVQRPSDETLDEFENKAKVSADCIYEQGTQWGKAMGLKYGCVVEDVITGLSIHCQGWKSAYFNPSKEAFVGIPPTTLAESLVQHKRWVEGHLHIFVSQNCAFIQGHGKIKLAHQMAYCIYNSWALNSIPTLFYVVVPSLHFLHGISLFPKIRSPWFLPFIYVILAKYAYSLGEALWIGETFKFWWNQQRIWLFRRTSAYLFGTIDASLKLLGIAKSGFNVTAKVSSSDEVSKRYEQEMMEFGVTSPLFTILATVAMINLVCLAGSIKKLALDFRFEAIESLILQFLLCGSLVLINTPIYQGLFLRKDKGCMPSSVALTSTTFAMLACLMPYEWRLHFLRFSKNFTFFGQSISTM